MLGLPLPPASGLVDRLRAWPVESQQQARRNAMVAATACAARRAEREDVAEFLAARYAPSPASTAADVTPEAPRRAHP